MSMKITWSERQQVVAIIVVAGLLLLILWFFLLGPLNRRSHLMEREIQTMSAQLAQSNYLLGEGPLRTKKEKEERRYEEYCHQLDQTLGSLSMIFNQNDLTNAIGPIDFKVALFDVRQRLRQKSNSTGLRLPHDLGIDDSVNSNEDPRRLMLQLRAVEEVVDLALTLRIKEIQSIEPMPPIRYAAGDGKTQIVEEYPVRLNFFGNAGNLFDLLQSILDPEHVFVVRNLSVERATPAQPDLLEVRAVLSALVFSAYTNALTVAIEKPEAPSGRRGY